VSPTAEGERVMRAAQQARVDVIAAALRTMSPDQRRAIVAAGPALLELAARVRRS
jgi:hypothetical protein